MVIKFKLKTLFLYLKVYKHVFKLLLNALKIDLFRFLGKNSSSLSVKEFPLFPNGKNALLEHPFFEFKKLKYFAQLYASHSNLDLIVSKRSYINSVSEIMCGNIYYKIFKGKQYKNTLLPISIPNPITEQNKAEIEVTLNNKNITLKSLKYNSFYYLPILKNSEVKLRSKKFFILGKPIKVKNYNKKNKKLVMSIFIDGLGSHILDKSFKYLMPNTYNFFSKGAKFFNAFSSGIWTLPGCGTLFSGLYPINHKMNDPIKISKLGEKYTTLGEYFQKNNFTTFQICSNFRKSPTYNYMLGFDRTLYKANMNCKETIMHTLEHMRSFSDNNNYIWMTLFDLHHFVDGVPDLSLQKEYSISQFNFYEDLSTKSIFRKQNKLKVERHKLDIFRLDFYLNILYSFILSNYREEEILISLCSDHGQRFFLDNDNILSEEKVRVPMFFRGENINPCINNQIVSTSDYLPTLLKYSIGKKVFGKKNKIDGEEIELGTGKKIKKKNYAISESIFPGQKYKAAIFFKNKQYFVESEEVINGATLNNLHLSNLNLNFSKLINKFKVYQKLSSDELHMCKSILLNR